MDPGDFQIKASLTREAMIVQSSHQYGAADNLLASNRAATAIVAKATLTTLPSHTFHATLSSGGKGAGMATRGSLEHATSKQTNIKASKHEKGEQL